MIENRLYIDIGQHPFSVQDCCEGGPGETVYAYSASRSLVDLGRLINLYLDLVDHRSQYAMNMTIGRRYTQACLVLASMFAIRSIGHSAVVMGVDIRDKSPIIMTHLRESFSLASCCMAAEKSHYREAHIWILYIGSLYERRLHLANENLSNKANSFTKLLVREVQAADVRTWQQMQAIERKFMQTDLLRPQGYTWFEDVLAEYDQSLLREHCS
jgi:hypothetical protein